MCVCDTQALREDPEFKQMFAEIQSGGMGALMKYMNDPKVGGWEGGCLFVVEVVCCGRVVCTVCRCAVLTKDANLACWNAVCMSDSYTTDGNSKHTALPSSSTQCRNTTNYGPAGGLVVSLALATIATINRRSWPRLGRGWVMWRCRCPRLALQRQLVLLQEGRCGHLQLQCRKSTTCLMLQSA